MWAQDLKVQGLNRLEECLDDFFSQELLEGDNQYACDTCAQKRSSPTRPTRTAAPAPGEPRGSGRGGAGTASLPTPSAPSTFSSSLADCA